MMPSAPSRPEATKNEPKDESSFLSLSSSSSSSSSSSQSLQANAASAPSPDGAIESCGSQTSTTHLTTRRKQENDRHRQELDSSRIHSGQSLVSSSSTTPTPALPLSSPFSPSVLVATTTSSSLSSSSTPFAQLPTRSLLLTHPASKKPPSLVSSNNQRKVSLWHEQPLGGDHDDAGSSSPDPSPTCQTTTRTCAKDDDDGDDDWFPPSQTPASVRSGMSSRHRHSNSSSSSDDGGHRRATTATAKESAMDPANAETAATSFATTGSDEQEDAFLQRLRSTIMSSSVVPAPNASSSSSSLSTTTINTHQDTLPRSNTTSHIPTTDLAALFAVPHDMNVSDARPGGSNDTRLSPNISSSSSTTATTTTMRPPPHAPEPVATTQISLPAPSSGILRNHSTGTVGDASSTTHPMVSRNDTPDMAASSSFCLDNITTSALPPPQRPPSSPSSSSLSTLLATPSARLGPEAFPQSSLLRPRVMVAEETSFMPGTVVPPAAAAATTTTPTAQPPAPAAAAAGVPRPVLMHRRTVSWGLTVPDSDNDNKGATVAVPVASSNDGSPGQRSPSTIIPQLPPPLTAAPGPHRRTPSAMTTIWLNQRSGDGGGAGVHDHSDDEGRSVKSKSRRRFQLEDVVKAGFEDEAETHILRAIEREQQHQQHQRQRSRHIRADTMTSTILSTADQAVHEFDLDAPLSLDQQQHHRPVSSSVPSGSVTSAASVGSRLSLSEDEVDPEVGEQPHHDSFTSRSVTMGSSLRSSNALSSANARARLGSVDSQIRPNPQLPRPQLQRAASNQAAMKKRHRRGLSVEDTLSGLTFAMHQVHEKQQEPQQPSEEQAYQEGEEMLPLTGDGEDHVVLGEADRFARNGVLLMEMRDDARKRERFDTLTAEELTPVGEEEGDDDVDEGEKEHTTSQHESSSPDSGCQNGGVNGEAGGTGVGQSTHSGVATTTRQSIKSARRNSVIMRPSLLLSKANQALHEDWQLWQNFFLLRRRHWLKYIKLVVCYIILPSTAIALILYYLSGNPPTGRDQNSDLAFASASWWLLYAGVREVITFSMSLGFQAFVIDFLALDTRILLHLCGPVVTLLIVQSKGWPFILFWWGVINFAMLHGDGAFAAHWLFWQDALGAFNARNPSGQVVDSPWNTTILATAMGFAGSTAIKRFVIGLWLGRRAFRKSIGCKAPHFPRFRNSKSNFFL